MFDLFGSIRSPSMIICWNMMCLTGAWMRLVFFIIPHILCRVGNLVDFKRQSMCAITIRSCKQYCHCCLSLIEALFRVLVYFDQDSSRISCQPLSSPSGPRTHVGFWTFKFRCSQNVKSLMIYDSHTPRSQHI